MVICLQQGADLHMAQLMPLPLTVSCFSKIQIGFTFLVAAHLGSPGKRAIKRVCMYSDINISQGSVATHLRCGGILKYDYVANLLGLTVKNCWKSVNTWQSYCRSIVASFSGHGVQHILLWKSAIMDISVLSTIVYFTADSMCQWSNGSKVGGICQISKLGYEQLWQITKFMQLFQF